MYGARPAEPLDAPKHVTDEVVTLTVGPAGFDNDVTKLEVQPAPSLITKVYVPAGKFTLHGLLAPPDPAGVHV